MTIHSGENVFDGIAVLVERKSVKRQITYAENLAGQPRDIVEYIVCHEFCHFAHIFSVTHSLILVFVLLLAFARDDYERSDEWRPPAFVCVVSLCHTIARGFEREDRRLVRVHPGRSLMPAARRHAPKSLTIVGCNAASKLFSFLIFHLSFSTFFILNS